MKLSKRYDPGVDRQRLEVLGREFRDILHIVCEHEPVVRGAIVTLRRRCGKARCHCHGGKPHETRVFLDRSGGRRRVRRLQGPDARHLAKAARLQRSLARLRGRLPALLAEALGACDRLGVFRQREGQRLYLSGSAKR